MAAKLADGANAEGTNGARAGRCRLGIGPIPLRSATFYREATLPPRLRGLAGIAIKGQSIVMSS